MKISKINKGGGNSEQHDRFSGQNGSEDSLQPKNKEQEILARILYRNFPIFNAFLYRIYNPISSFNKAD
jgi:hypothetical protein